jgi:hypothetical protein
VYGFREDVMDFPGMLKGTCWNGNEIKGRTWNGFFEKALSYWYTNV